MTMKPTVHKITITLRERTFVVAVLNEAACRTPSDDKMVRHYEAARRLAPAIKAWPDNEGKVELVMSCADSRSVRALLDEVRHIHHVALGRPRAQQKLAILSSPDYEFRCGDAVLSGAEARQLQLKFGIRTPQKPKPTVEHATPAGGDTVTFEKSFSAQARVENLIAHAHRRGEPIIILVASDPSRSMSIGADVLDDILGEKYRSYRPSTRSV